MQEQKINLIAISGKLGVGKDEVTKIIQYLVARKGDIRDIKVITAEYLGLTEDNWKAIHHFHYNWQNKKFADKLKDIACLLLGCTREQLEDRNYKEKELGEEWCYYTNTLFYDDTKKLIPYIDAPDEIANDTSWYIIKLTPRLLLQLLGTECGREIIHPNIWVNALMSEYKLINGNISSSPYSSNRMNNALAALKSTYPNWIISDMRFPNELDAVKNRGGITIRVNRYPKDIIIDGNLMIFDKGSSTHLRELEKIYQNAHASETSLDNANFDYVIDNNGTIEELVEKVRVILQELKII